MRSRLVAGLWCLYALPFAAIGVAMARDELDMAFPRPFIVAVVAAFVAGCAGILAHALGGAATLRPLWRVLCPAILAIPAIGLFADAVRPSPYNLANGGVPWLLNAALVIALLAPGYAANALLAYRRR